MHGISNAELFFAISAVGFVVLWILGAILLFYLIRVARVTEEILTKAKKDIDSLGDMTKETLEDIRDSALFSLIFRGKKKKAKKEKEEGK